MSTLALLGSLLLASYYIAALILRAAERD